MRPTSSPAPRPPTAPAQWPGQPAAHVRRPLAAAALAVSLALAACGGSDGEPEAAAPAPAPAASTLAGTAAVGAPITGGTLRIVDANGNVVASNVALGADGSFSGITLSGTGPWRLEACGFAGQNWTCVHSVAQQGGTANVTPLTSAVLLLASGSTPDALMSGAAGGLDASAVAAAQSTLRNGLAPVLGSAGVDGSLDLITGTLNAGSRTGYDRLLDAVQVNTGVDGQPFVQIGSRMGAGNLYLEQGAAAIGSLSADSAAASLPLAGLEGLFARMSDAIASANACSDPSTGFASTLAADAALSFGGPSITGAADVAQALCAFLGGSMPGQEAEPPRWGSRFMSPVLGRCDFSGAAPVCGVSFVLRDPEGGVESLGNGMAVTYSGGQWRFKGDRLPLAMHASARVQRDVRTDGPTPVVNYSRAIAFEIPAVTGLACARISQRNAEGNLVTFAYFKRHAGSGIERLSLWTADGNSQDRSLNPLTGSTRSSDDTWVALPEGADGDAAIRNFFRGGRNVLVDLYDDADCSIDFQVAGRSRYELEVDGVPPVWAALPALPWPDLSSGTQAALRNLALAADTNGALDVGWSFPRGTLAVNEVTVCSDRSQCGQGGVGRIGEARARPSMRSADVTLRSSVAVAANDNKAVALSGRNGEGLGLQATFLSCPATPAGQVCQDPGAQIAGAVVPPRARR